MNKGSAVALNWSHCIFYHHALTVKEEEKEKQKPVSLKSVLDEAVKIINFINS